MSVHSYNFEKIKIFLQELYLISIQYAQWQTTGPHDSFGTADWDLQRMWASERAMIMYNQGFIHPATLVPEELE